MLGANIVWLAWPSDLLVNLKPGLYQSEHRKQLNPRLCSLVFNVFRNPEIFEQLTEWLVSKREIRKSKSGLYRIEYWICKTQVLFQKAEVMLGANIVWLAWAIDLLVNSKQVIYQPKHKIQRNPRLCPSILNGFIKPARFWPLVECVVSLVKRRKLKSGFYCLYDCI